MLIARPVVGSVDRTMAPMCWRRVCQAKDSFSNILIYSCVYHEWINSILARPFVWFVCKAQVSRSRSLTACLTGWLDGCFCFHFVVVGFQLIKRAKVLSPLFGSPRRIKRDNDDNDFDVSLPSSSSYRVVSCSIHLHSIALHVDTELGGPICISLHP